MLKQLQNMFILLFWTVVILVAFLFVTGYQKIGCDFLGVTPVQLGGIFVLFVFTIVCGSRC